MWELECAGQYPVKTTVKKSMAAVFGCVPYKWFFLSLPLSYISQCLLSQMAKWI